MTPTQTPAVMRVKCPILAFFGTRGDIGGEKDLDLLNSSLQRIPGSPKLQTAMIVNGNHEYVGEEAQVAEKIAHWVEAELPK